MYDRDVSVITNADNGLRRHRFQRIIVQTTDSVEITLEIQRLMGTHREVKGMTGKG